MRRVPGVLALFLLLVVLSSRGPPTLRLPTPETPAPSAEVVMLPLPVVRAVELHVPPPPSLAGTGGKRLGEFKLGQAVTVQNGCLACHRIAGQGGPGPDLTHVGSMLSRRQIERAMVHPVEPMPSSAHMPRAKFKALVEFLSLLRR